MTGYYWECDQCGQLEFGRTSKDEPDGWSVTSSGSDICGECA